VSTTADRLAAALEGRYRIERELGAGGMATVYLAADLKHDRKVAIKVLKPELAVAIGAERFLAEIKTTANLQHPHILALHDSGTVDGTVFYVMPYVEGESLRDRLDREKQLPIDDALRIAGEVADALAYAHERGVIHRDIKPENILLQRGHAVVADFGIALAASKSGGSRMTETGMSLGTPTYMSPEQAMGSREVDARTDIYSLGCVLYEMLSGEPPFGGPTAQSIVAKVMTEMPRGLTAQRHTVPVHVDAAIATALEKLPADRFATAAQFGEAIRGVGVPGHVTGSARSAGSARARLTRGQWISAAAAAVVIAVASAAVAYTVGREAGPSIAMDAVRFNQRTFRTEFIFTSRLTNSSESIIYSAAGEGSTPRIYQISSGYPEPRTVSDMGVQLLSVSSKDEMAVLVRATYLAHRIFTGTLARMPIGGGAPREILAGVRDADWSPDGTELAIIREVGGRDRLEYPIGTVLYETSGYLADPRVSPDGKLIAFNEHPSRWDDRGIVAVVDLKGVHRGLTQDYWAVEGLAWTRDGRRLIYGAAIDGGFQQVHEVPLDGPERLGLPTAGNITMQDIGRDGRWLMSRDDSFDRLTAMAPGATAERDISWLDGSLDAHISADGLLVSFSDVSNAGGANYASMIRGTDGSAAVRLGEGSPRGQSHDKKWVVSVVPSSPQRLMLYPTGPGAERRVDAGAIETFSDAAFFPDGERLLVCGNEPSQAVRCYVQSLAGGAPRAITPSGVNSGVISPDGRSVVAAAIEGGYRMYSVADGSVRPIPGLPSDVAVLRFSPDGAALWIQRKRELPVRVERFDLATGRRSPLLTILSAQGAGLLWVSDVAVADDARSYVYVGREFASHLFELNGMK
jgi:serine/threonine protein kinase/dipeptidyl aminopeptidase/acylaminoacyl peptidase